MDHAQYGSFRLLQFYLPLVHQIIFLSMYVWSSVHLSSYHYQLQHENKLQLAAENFLHFVNVSLQLLRLHSCCCFGRSLVIISVPQSPIMLTIGNITALLTQLLGFQLIFFFFFFNRATDYTLFILIGISVLYTSISSSCVLKVSGVAFSLGSQPHKDLSHHIISATTHVLQFCYQLFLTYLQFTSQPLFCTIKSFNNTFYGDFLDWTKQSSHCLTSF